MECTGWRRLIGSPKLQIIFHKRATKYRSLLRKMTCKDKGSYESSPPCMNGARCAHRFLFPTPGIEKFWKILDELTFENFSIELKVMNWRIYHAHSTSFSLPPDSRISQKSAYIVVLHIQHGTHTMRTALLFSHPWIREILIYKFSSYIRSDVHSAQSALLHPPLDSRNCSGFKEFFKKLLWI